MSIEIRIAEPRDAAAACTVLRRSITECCVEDHHNDPAILDTWLGNKTPETVSNWFTSPANFSLVATRDGAPVGVALMTRAGKLSLCYLLPEARGQGIGKALLEAVEEQARQWEIKVLQVKSTASGQAFYAHQGYISSGIVKACYGLDTVFFWKQLNADPAAAAETRKRFCGCTGGQ